jgi:hypothetical protein
MSAKLAAVTADDGYWLSDDLEDQIDFACGIEAALYGLEANDLERHEGVKCLVRAHIDRLRQIQSRVDKMRGAARE